jgi:gliding motility-associated-like protein
MKYIFRKLPGVAALLLYTMTTWAQPSGYCGDTPPLSSSIAFVYFFQNTPVTVNSEAVEPGSYIIAVFEDDTGSWQCAGEVQWWGGNTIMTIRGEDTEYEGYEEGEALRFYIQYPDGCLLTAVEATYSTEAAYPAGGAFTQGGRSRVQSLSATFEPEVALTTVADTCDAGTGQAIIESVGEIDDFTVAWSNGESGQEITGLPSGPLDAIITTADGCTVAASTEIPSADCPLLQCNATCNNNPNGDQGCLPFTANFADASQSEAGIRTYLWDFGDGNTSDEPSPAHIYNQAGDYQASLIVFDGYQYDTATLEITVFPAPTAEWDYEAAICTPEQISFTTQSADDIVSWSWAFEDGTTSDDPMPSLTFPTNGEAVSGTLTITSGEGCTNELPVELDIPEAYDLQLSEGETILPSCTENNGSINLMANGGATPYTFDWSHDAMLNQSFASNLPTGDYTVTLTDANDCVANFTLSLVDTTQLPTPNLGDDVEVCPGESTVLAAGEQPGNTYLWSTGAASPTLTVSAGGDYAVTVTNADGCTASDTVSVMLAEAITASITASDNQLCPDEALTLTGTGASQLLWIDTSFAITTPNAASVTFVPASTAIYGLIAMNECFSDTAYTVIEVATQLAFAGPDTCVANQRTVVISASGAESYQWWDETQKITLGNAAQLQVSPDSTTVFYVEMTDSAGCSYLDSVQVEVLFLDELDLQAINTITPNGDGYNDVLEFPNLTKFDTYTLTVFNRHGTTVYDSFNYQNDWDGTRNGAPLPEGVYFYILRIGQQELKSSLTIIRD